MTELRVGAPDELALSQTLSEGPASSSPGPRLGGLVATLVVVSLLGALEVTIIGSSLATIVGDLGSLSALAWVATAFTLAATVATPVLGQLGDIHGRRRLFLLSLGVFIGGSLLCALAPSMGVLVAARALQGVGSAGTSLLSQTILADVLPPNRRPQVMSLLASVFAVAIVAGPLVGGILTDTVGWRWSFLGIVPLGFACFVAAYLTIPRAPGVAQRGSFDVLGATLLGLSLTSLVFLLTMGPTRLGWMSPGSGVLAVVGLSSFAALIRAERGARHPILPLRMFSDRVVVGAVVLAVVHGAGLLAVIGYLPAYAQMHYGLSATMSGVVPMAIVAGLLVSSNGAGALIARTGSYRIFPIVGSAVAATALAVTAATLHTASLVALCLGLMFFGLGAGAFMHLPVVIAQNQAPSAQMGVATSMVNLVRQASSAVAVAAIGTALTTSLIAQLGGRASNSAGDLTPAALRAAPTREQAQVAHAYANALAPILIGLAVIFVIGLAASVLTPAVRLRSHLDQDAHDAV